MHRHSKRPFDLRRWLAVAARRSLGSVLLAASILVSSCQALHKVDTRLMPFNPNFWSSQTNLVEDTIVPSAEQTIKASVLTLARVDTLQDLTAATNRHEHHSPATHVPYTFSTCLGAQDLQSVRLAENRHGR